jgi:hypothetical protein
MPPWARPTMSDDQPRDPDDRRYLATDVEVIEPCDSARVYRTYARAVHVQFSDGYQACSESSNR